MLFLNKTEYFVEHQYEFRYKSSTENAAIGLTNHIKKKIDRAYVVVGIFLDLSKAFDTADHKILLKKIELAGIRGPLLHLIGSYLDNRYQRWKIGKSFSSFLGPLLFLIYVNDFGILNILGGCIFMPMMQQLYIQTR